MAALKELVTSGLAVPVKPMWLSLIWEIRRVGRAMPAAGAGRRVRGPWY